MMQWIMLGSIACLLSTLASPVLLAQANCKRLNPYATDFNSDPRVRRAYREKAVAAFGPKIRDFVESQGEEGVAALFACTKPVAVKLAEFHTSGELANLPRPHDLLRVIAQPQHGDDVALWAIQHANELADADCFDAYLMSPLDYALGLKHLESGAADARARRLHNSAATTTAQPLTQDEKMMLVVGIGFS